MKRNPAYILEQYIIGKDQNTSKILETIYEETAEVEFAINPTNISFPSKIVGNSEIARILSADFNKKFERVKTYYLSDTIYDKLDILEQPWLVVMKEIGKDLTRIGTGHYNWHLREHPHELKIFKHKIYIHLMLEIHDPSSKQLQKIQERLEYPWVKRHVVANVLKDYENLTEITRYVLKYK